MNFGKMKMKIYPRQKEERNQEPLKRTIHIEIDLNLMIQMKNIHIMI